MLDATPETVSKKMRLCWKVVRSLDNTYSKEVHKLAALGLATGYEFVNSKIKAGEIDLETARTIFEGEYHFVERPGLSIEMELQNG